MRRGRTKAPRGERDAHLGRVKLRWADGKIRSWRAKLPGAKMNVHPGQANVAEGTANVRPPRKNLRRPRAKVLPSRPLVKPVDFDLLEKLLNAGPQNRSGMQPRVVELVESMRQGKGEARCPTASSRTE